MKKIFTLLLLAATFAACSDSNPNGDVEGGDSINRTIPNPDNSVPPLATTPDSLNNNMLDSANKMMDTASSSVSLKLDTGVKVKTKM